MKVVLSLLKFNIGVNTLVWVDNFVSKFILLKLLHHYCDLLALRASLKISQSEPNLDKYVLFGFD